MIRNSFIFLGTFVAGALIALVARAALFNPHAGHENAPVVRTDYGPMVSNPLAPAKTEASSAPTPTASSAPHATHEAVADPVPSNTPVNTICAICGMAVDPKIPTVEYQGKTIGFGCKMCPPKFAAEPDRYGPIYLRNEVIKK